MGFPAPNPHVGCVIVAGGEIVGEGFHSAAGEPHAEVVALKQAGDRAKNADVFVTLEPCNHSGRTPPCADALISAGVKKVWIACQDPNPLAAGGADAIGAAGISVETGFLEHDAESANRRFLTAMRQRRPFVCIKAAVSLDGKLAKADGTSKWITSPAAREEGHRLRAEMGVVLVGAGTVRADDPELTARIAGVKHQPLRIVLDPRAELLGTEKVFQPPGLTWRIVGPDHGDAPCAFPCPLTGDDFDLSALLKMLWDRGATGLLVEGGAKTIHKFLVSVLVNRIELFIAPKLFGAGVSWAGNEELPENLNLTVANTRTIGPDLLVSIDVKGS